MCTFMWLMDTPIYPTPLCGWALGSFGCGGVSGRSAGSRLYVGRLMPGCWVLGFLCDFNGPRGSTHYPWIEYLRSRLVRCSIKSGKLEPEQDFFIYFARRPVNINIWYARHLLYYSPILF
jgi:hypothetical protein